MSRTLVLVTFIGLMFGGVAEAGRGKRGGGHNHHQGGVVVRDHRGPGPAVRDHRGPRHKHHRGGHIRASRGRYVFPGGVVRVYKRPVIRHRYYDMRVRPAIIVEHYDPVPGYVWVQGGWTWGGAEWIWTPGYYAVAEPVPAPSVGASVSIGGSISIR